MQLLIEQLPAFVEPKCSLIDTLITLELLERRAMPWPDFSELSFGFSFLREFEQMYAPKGNFPTAPDFITQNAEAKKGYDVEVAIGGSTPVFFQFKRSFVLKTKNANEIQNGDFVEPILFRMHLREKDSYRQHVALSKLEDTGAMVFYVTSQIETMEELSKYYISKSVISSASALFSPTAIKLPNKTDPHHVTFEAHGDFGYVYSEEGVRFQRKYNRPPEEFVNLLKENRRTSKQNKILLQKFCDIMLKLIPRNGEISRLAEKFDNPVKKASILSFLVLDTHLTLFHGN